MDDRRLLESLDGDLHESVVKIAREFERGFEAVQRIPLPAVTIFGSACVRGDHLAYIAGRSRPATPRGGGLVGHHRGRAGGDGGGEPRRAGRRGLSVGFNIELPHEQVLESLPRHRRSPSALLRPQGDVREAAEGFVIFLGGFGTLDELFEALTLIQTGKVLDFPVVLFDTDYWEELLDWIRGSCSREARLAEDVDSCTSRTTRPRRSSHRTTATRALRAFSGRAREGGRAVATGASPGRWSAGDLPAGEQQEDPPGSATTPRRRCRPRSC